MDTNEAGLDVEHRWSNMEKTFVQQRTEIDLRERD